MVDLVDELRHEPGDHPYWHESWYFDVVAPDASWGLYAQIALYPHLHVAWWWTVIARENEQLLLVRDQTLDLPRLRLMSMEVRGSGLWADVHCHEAMQRWQVNFEGIAVGLDEPAEAHRSERGDRVPVEYEFEWEAAGEPFATADGYAQNCVVTGDAEILGSEPLSLDEPVRGVRTHTWGVRDWATSEVWARGRQVPEAEMGRPLLTGGLLVDAPDGRTLPLHRAVSRFTAPEGMTDLGWMEWSDRADP